jgi:hypothetical protein
MEKHNCFSEGPIVDWTENGLVRGENDHPLDAAEVHANAGKLASATVKNFKFKKNRDLLLELVKLYDTDNFTNKNIAWEKYNGV